MVVLSSLWQETQKYLLQLITQFPLYHSLQISTVTDVLYSNICFVVRRINVGRRMVNIYDRCLWKFARSHQPAESSSRASITRPAFRSYGFLASQSWAWLLGSYRTTITRYLLISKVMIGKCWQAAWFRVNDLCVVTRFATIYHWVWLHKHKGCQV